MMKGERFTGWDGLHRWNNTKNYHIADKNGRAYLCGCFKSIWRIRYQGKVGCIRQPSSMMENKGSKQKLLTQWYREYTFEQNLERNEILRKLYKLGT